MLSDTRGLLCRKMFLIISAYPQFVVSSLKEENNLRQALKNIRDTPSTLKLQKVKNETKANQNKQNKIKRNLELCKCNYHGLKDLLQGKLQNLLLEGSVGRKDEDLGFSH